MKYINIIKLLFITLSFQLLNADILKKDLEHINKYAQESFNTANRFGDLLYKDNNGISRVSILNKRIVLTFDIKEKFGLTDNQLILGMILKPSIWRRINLFEVKSEKLKKIIHGNTQKELVSYNDLINSNGNYKLKNYVDNALKRNINKRNFFEKEVLVLDNKLNTLYTLIIGGFHKIFPIQNKRWLSFLEAHKESKKNTHYKIGALSAVFLGNMANLNYINANKNIDIILKYQNTLTDFNDIDKKLHNEIEKISSKLPKRINKILTLVQIKKTNMRIAYYYKADFDTKSPNKNNAIKNSRNRICKSTNLRETLDDGYTLYYNYQLSNGVLDYDYYVSKKDCK